MLHGFNVDIAKKFGVIPSIIISYFENVVAYGDSENCIKIDGKYWLIASISTFEKIFPYLTKSQIRYHISKLISNGVITNGNFIESKTDNTKYYTLSDNYIER